MGVGDCRRGEDRLALLPARGGKGQLYHRSFIKAVKRASGSSEISTDLKHIGKNPSQHSQAQGSVTRGDKGLDP